MDITKEMIETGTIIDVRTYDEWEEGHFEEAIHIPLDEIIEQVALLATLKKPLILYCRSGNRSGQAIDLLESEDLKDMHNGINQDFLETIIS